MQQVTVGGYLNTCPVGGTREYNGVQGGYEWNSTEQNVAQMCSIDTTGHSLFVELSGPPNGATKTLTFTLYVNGNPTAVTVTITNAETSGNITGESVDLAPGDWISIACDAANGPDAVSAQWSFGFNSDTAKESMILGHCWARNDVTRYGAVCACAAVDDGVENNARQIMPTDGAMSHLYVKASNSPGAGGDTFTITLRESVGGDTASAVVLTDAETTGNTADSVDSQPGDVLTVSTVPGNSPANTNVRIALGWKFTADAAGETIVMGGTSDNLNTGANEYNYFTTGRHTTSWTGTEANVQQLCMATSIEFIYGKLQNAPGGGGDQFNFAARINGATGNNTVVLDDTTATGTDATDAVAAADNLAILSDPDGTPAGGDGYWGFVLTISAGEEKGPVTATVLIGCKVTATRAVAFDRDAAVIVGELVTASRLPNYPRTATVLIGELVTASVAAAFSRTASVLIGELVTATRAVAAARAAAVLVGELVTASRVPNYPRAASVLVGELVTASRAAAVSRTATVLIGELVTASRTAAFSRAATVLVGELVTATRVYGLAVTASVLVGELVTATRTVAFNRTATVLIGELVTASRLGAFVRTSTVLIGNLVSATGIASGDATVIASVIVGIRVTGSGCATFSRVLRVAVGRLDITRLALGRLPLIRTWTRCGDE